MASVSVSGVEGTASEIQGVNDILKNTATNASTVGDRIAKLATEFASYNNQITAENPPHYEQVAEGDSICTYNVYDTWVTTTGGLESRASSLASKAEEINSVVDKISSKVADVQTIAVAIQGYIDSIQDILSNSDIMAKHNINVSSGVIASAFLALGRDGVTKANIATSGTDINSRNFLDYDSIKDDEKLSGGLLSFEKQEDGSYLIKKDGESTGYYTTGLAAGLYMKTLVTGVSKETIAKEQAKIKNSVETMKNTQHKKDSSVTSKNETSPTTKADNKTSSESDTIDGDDMVQKYHEQSIEKLEQEEQYKLESGPANIGETILETYKGEKNGTLKIINTYDNGSKVIDYRDKTGNKLYTKKLNSDGTIESIKSYNS